MIIGIIGKARSGKDTFADMLYEEMDKQDILFLKMAYAGYLKAIAIEGFDLTPEQTSGNLKEVPDKRYPKEEGGYWTPREILQFLGTEAYRTIDNNFWIRHLFKGIDDFIERPDDGDKFNFIITDCRFPDEAAAIEERGGILVRVSRDYRDTITNDTHISETALDSYDYKQIVEIDNSGTVEELRLAVLEFIELFGLDKLKKVGGESKWQAKE